MKRFLRRLFKGGKSESGQALVIIVAAMVGLIAIVGLVVDGGILYIAHGKLRRAVDAAAVSAANQIREGYTIDELTKAANEFLRLNQVDAINVRIENCDTTPNDPELCPEPGKLAKKLVRVTASLKVNFGFLPVIGIRNTIITASAIGEAASVDAVLVLDTSASMAFEGDGDPSNDSDLSNCPDGNNDPNQADCNEDDPSVCNLTDSCQPFRKIKDVAIEFVNRLYYPYDRVALVTFDRNPDEPLPLTANKNAIIANINNLRVFQPPACPTAHGPCRNYDNGRYLGLECPIYRETGDPTTCTSSNIGGGLQMGGFAFAHPGNLREDSLWVLILLAGGPANTGYDLESPQGDKNRFCPSTTWEPPFCRDNDAGSDSRHAIGSPNYDADDYAYDMADFVADPDTGQGGVIFTIGLGNLIRNAPSGDPLDAEELLKYAAEQSGGSNANHGMYYYAPDAAALREIFRQIAENIATRLSR